MRAFVVSEATAASRTVGAFVLSTPIRRDAEGRYCLNDLHRSAGGQQRHQPRYWLANEQTKELVTAVSNSGKPLFNPVDLSRGRYGGTYVHGDLAIDYAAWISPTFKLEVYRAFKESRKDRETDVGTAVMPEFNSEHRRKV